MGCNNFNRSRRTFFKFHEDINRCIWPEIHLDSPSSAQINGCAQIKKQALKFSTTIGNRTYVGFFIICSWNVRIFKNFKAGSIESRCIIIYITIIKGYGQCNYLWKNDWNFIFKSGRGTCSIRSGEGYRIVSGFICSNRIDFGGSSTITKIPFIAIGIFRYIYKANRTCFRIGGLGKTSDYLWKQFCIIIITSNISQSQDQYCN